MSVNGSRALVIIIASRRPMHSAEPAGAMALPPSNATRTCDRLVVAKLLGRRDNPTGWRHLLLTLTKERPQVLGLFAAAGGGPADRDLWSVGWATGPAPDEGAETAAPSNDNTLNNNNTRASLGRKVHPDE